MSQDRIKRIGTRVLSSEWARLEAVEFDYLRRDGQWQRQKREIYHRGHGAALLLYNLEQATVILTRQFRYPAFEVDGDGFLLEVPAGVIEGDDPLATVLQEAEEETGFHIGDATFLFKAYVSPGSVTEQLHYYAAPYRAEQRIGAGGGLESEGEDIEVMEVRFDDVRQWIGNGSITDGKTLLLMQYAALHVFA